MSLAYAKSNIVSNVVPMEINSEEIPKQKSRSKKVTDVGVMETDKIKKPKRKTIPKSIKSVVWDTYVGVEIGQTLCLCCKHVKISQHNFECGHVVSDANGGELSVDNLRPICSQCNKSMSTKNMAEFMKEWKLGELKEKISVVSEKPPITRKAAICKFKKENSLRQYFEAYYKKMDEFQLSKIKTKLDESQKQLMQRQMRLYINMVTMEIAQAYSEYIRSINSSIGADYNTICNEYLSYKTTVNNLHEEYEITQKRKSHLQLGFRGCDDLDEHNFTKEAVSKIKELLYPIITDTVNDGKYQNEKIRYRHNILKLMFQMIETNWKNFDKLKSSLEKTFNKQLPLNPFLVCFNQLDTDISSKSFVLEERISELKKLNDVLFEFSDK